MILKLEAIINYLLQSKYFLQSKLMLYLIWKSNSKHKKEIIKKRINGYNDEKKVINITLIKWKLKKLCEINTFNLTQSKIDSMLFLAHQNYKKEEARVLRIY